MKKVTLVLSIILMWGCSQAQDSEVVEGAKTVAKEVVTDQVEAVKAEAMEKATDKVSAMTNDAVSDQVDAVKGKAMDKVQGHAHDHINSATNETVGKVSDQLVVTTKDKISKASAYQAGIHYNVINPAYETNSDEVIVYEFFSYGCGHCATFEPYMHKLEASMPEKATIVRVPVVFNAQWQPLAQAYYTFEALGITEQAHGPMFEAIHQHKKQFRTIDAIAVWAASSFGVDKEKFLSTAKSFVVDGQVRKGMKMLQVMGVSSTPTLVTNGKFTPNSKALKSRNDIIEITQYLVNQEIEAM